MSLPLEGSAVLIVGAAGGIGSALADRLARSGARLALAGRNLEALERLAARTGGLPIRADAERPADLDARPSRAPHEGGRELGAGSEAEGHPLRRGVRDDGRPAAGGSGTQTIRCRRGSRTVRRTP